MFRNILDSTEVQVQPDVTCLVGKNESGKTAFLQALWRLRPARTNPGFSVPEQYPAWLEKRHRQEGKKLEDIRPVEAVYDWEQKDRQFIEGKFGSKVVSKDAEVKLWKNYSNKFVWEHGCDERKAIENVLAGSKLPDDISTEFKGIETFAALKAKIVTLQETKKGDEVASAALNHLESERAALVGESDFGSTLWGLIEPRIPKFFYFADYSKLPYSVRIDHVLASKDDQLNESEATARALLRLGGAEQDYLLNPEYERRKRELENVANALTDDVLTYWSQNSQLRVQPEITQRTEQRPNGQHAVLDELKIRIWDNRHSLSLPFNEHSAGFQWFFSFLAAFSEFEHSDPGVIILLDEPAVGLHARAQGDFLRFIRERLAKQCQVIYTTHSPFMIEPGHLERVRLVEDFGKEEGSNISADVMTRDSDTLFPLQGALGYDLVQHLFVAENNLVVEGTSDYAYLRIISDHLATLANRTSLDPAWSIVPVGGADAVPTFVALLGNHLKLTVILDSRKEGHQRLNRLASDGYLAKRRIILIGDILLRKLADVEDLFSPEEYLDLYNQAFNASIRALDLTGSDQIVTRIARHIGVERFDHGKPADVLLRNRDSILPKLSEETLSRFENLFEKVNSTLHL